MGANLGVNRVMVDFGAEMAKPCSFAHSSKIDEWTERAHQPSDQGLSWKRKQVSHQHKS